MIADSIFVFGAVGARARAGMKRGTIVARGGLADRPLPTSLHACTFRTTFLRPYLHLLRGWDLPVTAERIGGLFRCHDGDTTALSKGEILVYDQR